MLFKLAQYYRFSGRSQDTDDARAQDGHTAFLKIRGLLCEAVQKQLEGYGGMLS